MISLSLIKRSIFWLSDVLHGGVIIKYYSLIRKTLKSKDKGLIIQQNALNSILDYATSNSSFYASYSGKILQNFQ